MALSVINNVAALNVQNNLTRSSDTLSKSLERLSSGLKINRGADGPASLVVSEQQRAQINGLKSAIDETNKAIAFVQTGEGALNEINSLLGKARGLALDSANNAQDSDALVANQSEIANLLATINNIATSTQFGNQALFVSTDGGDNTRTFQIGATASQTTSITLQAVDTTALGKGVSDEIANLSKIDVSNSDSAQNSLEVIDQAISQVSNLRGTLGAFQSNTLETNANNLRASLQNTLAAESVIRDTDFATEIANFTRQQVQLQAGQTVLGNANQIPQLVASLLRGQRTQGQGETIVTPYQTYQQQQVQNATRIELLLGLYDKAIQHLTQAQQAMAQEDISTAAPLILQAQVIVYALADGVDLKYGEISQNMLRLYEFVLYRLGGTDAQDISDAIKMLTILREGLRDIEPKAKAMEFSGKIPRAQIISALHLTV